MILINPSRRNIKPLNWILNLLICGKHSGHSIDNRHLQTDNGILQVMNCNTSLLNQNTTCPLSDFTPLALNLNPWIFYVPEHYLTYSMFGKVAIHVVHYAHTYYTCTCILYKLVPCFNMANVTSIICWHINFIIYWTIC